MLDAPQHREMKMYKYNLSGKTLIVTGAETGIGRAIALRAARDGASVTAAGINEEGLREVLDTAEKNGFKNKFSTMKVDIRDVGQVQDMVDKT